MSAAPKRTGRSTISAMESIIAGALTAISSPAKRSVRNGVTKGARSVVAIVMVTDRATSPLAR